MQALLAPFLAVLQAASALATGPTDLADALEPLRAEYALPGLAAAVVRGDALAAAGAVGVRRLDRDEAVTTDDRWHLGSCTKSMTATWIAQRVERGDLAWDTTIGDVYPELFESGEARAVWADVPLEWLLQNRSGAPHDVESELWGRLWRHDGTPREQRRALVRGVLAAEPEAPPGTRYVYSNAGFSIAAAMAEEVTGEAWEEAIVRDLFAPLGMATAGFGAPGTKGAHDEPRGHRKKLGFLVPVVLGPGDDNPSAIAPAGKAHASIADWAKYAALHLEGPGGGRELLSAESFAKLHEPQLNGYAMGWMQRRWGDDAGLWHNGSNGMWYCEVALLHEHDLAVLVATNRGDARAREALPVVLATLLSRALDGEL